MQSGTSLASERFNRINDPTVAERASVYKLDILMNVCSV